MEKIPQSGRIQKTTTTSKIAFIGLAAATMMISLSIIATQQEASAAQPKEWCFPLEDEGVPVGFLCFDSSSSSLNK